MSGRCAVSRINVGRVIIGGLVAGLVINVSEFILNTWLLGAEMNAAMVRLNLPPIGGPGMAVFTVMGFAVGIATLWLYAAIRPRFSPGPTTALVAGGLVWFFAYFYGSIGMAVMGLFPMRLIAVGMIWGLGELLLAALAGAALYQEA